MVPCRRPGKVDRVNASIIPASRPGIEPTKRDWLKATIYLRAPRVILPSGCAEAIEKRPRENFVPIYPA